uniref:Uncharacterized protein n=1 Tax=Glossina brevipalpis TaxID=37001 RepID=A0A1A9W321_9MUSC
MARWPELPLIVLKGISLACFAGAFAAGYHLIAGFLLFITIIKVVAIESCGNDAMSTILGVPGSVGVVAVILHIVGGAVCLAFLPKAERTLSLPRRAWSVPD